MYLQSTFKNNSNVQHFRLDISMQNKVGHKGASKELDRAANNVKDQVAVSQRFHMLENAKFDCLIS